MQELELELGNYYGGLNELKLGLIPEQRPVKPEALIYTEQMDTLGIPLVAGGVLDQPYIFMQEYKVCKNFMLMQEILARSQEANQNVQSQ